MGTPAYMSPEPWRGIDVDAQSDIWAVGIILYEMLTGALPLAPTTRTRLAEVQDLDVAMPSLRELHLETGALGAIGSLPEEAPRATYRFCKGAARRD